MDFEVRRDDLRATRIVDAPPVALDDGQIRLGIERWAFTTNNITYAVAGDMLDYWGFFPADEGWGRLPAMGLGTVIESRHPEIALGGRYFGFYPMSSEHVLTAQTRRDGFRDVGPHRARHAQAYTDFTDVARDPMFREDRVDEYLLLTGMFMTSFLVDDFLADADFHGATHTLITSASSKTSISLADCLSRRDQHSVGLTSERNRTFVEGLGLYDTVITYDEVDQLDPATPAVVVDMAGNDAVRRAIHGHLDDLRASLLVGATHWEADAVEGDLPGPRPEMFFAPGQIAKRSAEWGAEELFTRVGGALDRVLERAPTWLTVEHHTGPDSVVEVHRTLVDGRADPSVGYILSLSTEDLDGELVSPG